MRIKSKAVHCLDRSAFKVAFLRNSYEEMLHIIRTSTLLGQSIIAYLQQKGFPEVTCSWAGLGYPLT